MLILIAGITGNLGQPLAKSLLKRGHQVRGLGRSADKLASDLRSQLESFVPISDYDDLAGLAKGVAGVDAVVCAYAPLQILHLEGQLMLWRAAEKAGVKRFISASWNYDWRTMTVGQHETYDPIIMFARQTALTSQTLKPVFIFVGVLAETLFAVPGHGNFSPAHNGVWDPAAKEMHIWGPKSVVWHWTTEADCAELTAAIWSALMLRRCSIGRSALGRGRWRISRMSTAGSEAVRSRSLRKVISMRFARGRFLPVLRVLRRCSGCILVGSISFSLWMGLGL
jgi:hypothetical protein